MYVGSLSLISNQSLYLFSDINLYQTRYVLSGGIIVYHIYLLHINSLLVLNKIIYAKSSCNSCYIYKEGNNGLLPTNLKIHNIDYMYLENPLCENRCQRRVHFLLHLYFLPKCEIKG